MKDLSEREVLTATLRPGPPAARARPLGVAVVAVVELLFATLLLGLATFILVAGAVAGYLAGAIASSLEVSLPSFVTALIGGIAAVFAALFVSFSILLFSLATGTLRGRPWAWTATLVLGILVAISSVVDVFMGVFTSLIDLAIAGLVIWYFYEPGVKAFFGKSVMRAFWQRRTPVSP